MANSDGGDDHRIVRIEEKVDHIKDTMTDIHITLAAQHESLKEHMRRTMLLEQALEPIKTDVGYAKIGIRLITTIAAIALAVAEFLYYSGIHRH